jgi:hypothetical protein
MVSAATTAQTVAGIVRAQVFESPPRIDHQASVTTTPDVRERLTNLSMIASTVPRSAPIAHRIPS